ncbi:MAG: NAD(P)H-dependent oxidoreductase [Chitinophagales bacterium]|nr:NAD(P)H-dependent oxidoreductase [Chitinophagales bacterium]
MITIISATNRKESNTIKVAREYERLLIERDQPVQVLSLQDFPKDMLSDMMYDEDNETFLHIQQQYFFPIDKIIFILPEYNGSMPGILKMLIDASDIKRAFYGKKALLVGIATGRSGNVRGMDHLTGILHYLKVTVHWNKLPISKINHEIDPDGRFYIPETTKVVQSQIDDFILF